MHPQNDANGRAGQKAQVGGARTHARRFHRLDAGLMGGCVHAPSLLEKHRDGGEVDFPLPLATADERERLIYEKDEEVRFITAWFICFYRSCGGYFFKFFFQCVVEEDAGSAGKNSGADATHPKRWLLTPIRERKGGFRNTFVSRIDCCRRRVRASERVMGLQRKATTASLNKARRFRFIPEKHIPALKTQQQVTDQLRYAASTQPLKSFFLLL